MKGTYIFIVIITLSDLTGRTITSSRSSAACCECEIILIEGGRGNTVLVVFQRYGEAIARRILGHPFINNVYLEAPVEIVQH